MYNCLINSTTNSIYRGRRDSSVSIVTRLYGREIVFRFSQTPRQALDPNRCTVQWLTAVAYPGFFFLGGGGDSTTSVEDRGQENGDLWAVAPIQGFRSICKWVKPVILLGCYGCISHGTGNLARLCQNFGISGGGGMNPSTPPPSVRPWLRGVLSPRVKLLRCESQHSPPSSADIKKGLSYNVTHPAWF
jgi:hypothetical protein